jgi:predicted nucleic acid-binding protein
MSDRAFLDTSVLVYALGQHDERSARAEELLEAGGMVSVQVLNELAAVGRRKLAMPWEDVVEALDAIRVLCPSPVPLTIDTHDAALRLAQRYGFHIYDALILAAAIDAECAVVYSEDLQHGQVIDGSVTVRNPFRA